MRQLARQPFQCTHKQAAAVGFKETQCQITNSQCHLVPCNCVPSREIFGHSWLRFSIVVFPSPIGLRVDILRFFFGPR